MKFRFVILFSFALFVLNCATSVAPGGGPEDKYPPRVAGVYPSPGSVNISSELNIHLQFDEWISPTIPRSAVTISPPLEKKLRFEVDGDELYINGDFTGSNRVPSCFEQRPPVAVQALFQGGKRDFGSFFRYATYRHARCRVRCVLQTDL